MPVYGDIKIDLAKGKSHSAAIFRASRLDETPVRQNHYRHQERHRRHRKQTQGKGRQKQKRQSQQNPERGYHLAQEKR